MTVVPATATDPCTGAVATATEVALVTGSGMATAVAAGVETDAAAAVTVGTVYCTVTNPAPVLSAAGVALTPVREAR